MKKPIIFLISLTLGSFASYWFVDNFGQIAGFTAFVIAGLNSLAVLGMDEN